MIESLISALGLELGLTSKEIADVVWLALQMNEVDRLPELVPDRPGKVQSLPQPQSTVEPPFPPSERRERSESKPSEPQAGLYAPDYQDSASMAGALALKVPDARSMREPLSLARALKPLLRKVMTGYRMVLDETATVERIAEEGVWLSVLQPSLEPWLELALVVDESVSMQIWRRTIVELQRFMEHYGVFRDVRVWGLVTDEQGQVQIRPGMGKAAMRQGLRRPSELIDPSGRRLILVATDCVSPLWRDGTIQPALKLWSASGPMAIVQMLPEWLWARTGLGLASTVRFQSMAAGLANQQLRVRDLSPWDDVDVETGVKVPVVMLEPERFGAWAEMMTGKGGAWATGVIFESAASAVSLPLRQDEALDGEQRVQQFRVTASPMARQLAGLLASAPVISLPIVRIIQERLLKDSRQVHVAEVFLGGLLKPLVEITPETNVDSVQYEFLDGVRDVLLELMRTSETVNVLNEVSQFVAERLGLSIDAFMAVLRSPHQIEDQALINQARPFAIVTAQIIRQLGQEYSTFAETLELAYVQLESLPPVEYCVGGCLPRDCSSYLMRSADRDLYEGLKAGQFCYVLGSRQTGKSSLRVRTMARLQADGIVCVSIDMIAIVSAEVTAEQWYLGVLWAIVKQVREQTTGLADWKLPVLRNWWVERKGLSYVERWGKFFEVLLGEVGERVVILMDEIDSMLGLDFRADEFFAVIRECYSRRVDESQYERLTFALLGVCAPQDLIQDKRQTPFNIGRSIDLKGFQLEEAMPLRAGFVEKSKNLRAVLAAILDWTGGQPFLTQKLCHLVTQASDGIPFGKESDWVTALVKSQVLENWDTNDEQIHFRTMRDRLLNSAENSPLVLHIYQQILSYGEVVLNNNSEQQVLILSGLVIKRAGKLQVSNRIYKAIFNQDWITRRISELRPYRESLRNWLASDRKNTSYLLHGQSLEDALAWSEGKNLAPEDYQFISASQALAQTAHRPKVRKVLILSANPKDTATLRINEEVRKIQAELMRSRGRELFEIVMRSAVRPDDLQRILLDVNPQIVHFSGHGARVEGIALEDEMGELKVMSNQALGRLFRQFGCIECVVLNACYSEPQAEVLHRSVPYVLGISQAIGDRASQEFSLAFYDGLGAGRDYQEAYKLGLSVISNDAVAATPRLLIGGVDIEKEIFPFTYGAPVSADRFYGRKRAIAEMKNRIGAASPQCINLVGLRRSGKTSLLHYIRSRPNEFFTPDQKPLLVLLDLQDGRYHTPIGMNEGLRQGILDATGTSPWKEDENDDPYTIEDALIALRESGVRLIVMLDELEQIGQRLAVFRYWGDDWRSKASAELLTLVIATGRSIGEVYEQFSLTSPFANIFSKTVLGSLEPEVWRSLVREGLPRVTEQELEWVDAVSGGLPYYVQLAASMLFQYSDLAEAETEFWFQAEDRFGELWRDLNGPERSALKFAMGLGGVEPGRGLRDRMVRWGLLRSDGRLFSSAFGEWIRENGEAV